jgi:hypothetical protein
MKLPPIPIALYCFIDGSDANQGDKKGYDSSQQISHPAKKPPQR